MPGHKSCYALRTLSRFHLKNFVLVSVFIALIDIAFVYLSIQSSRQLLDTSIQHQTEQVTRSYNSVLQQAYSNMLTLGSFIASDREVQKLFLDAKLAVESEGGGAGGEQAQYYRNQLFEKVSASWSKLEEKYGVKQLHFYIGSPATSLLRVHKAERFGDNLTNIRHTAVDALLTQTEIVGFEVGRAVPSLRAVVPVYWHEEKQAPVFIGVLDVGMTFKSMLLSLDKSLDMGGGVVIDGASIDNTMWQDERDRYVEQQWHEECQCIIESQTRPEFGRLLENLYVDQKRDIHDASIILSDEESKTHVVLIPLQEYKAARDSTGAKVGTVVFWKDATPLFSRYDASVNKTKLYGVLGFVLAELAFFWAFIASISNLGLVIRERTHELQTSENNLNQAQQLAKTGSWKLDMATRKLVWSEQIFDIFEFDLNEVEPNYERFIAAIHPDDREKVDKAFQLSVKSRQPYKVAHRLLFPDGRIKHVVEEGVTTYRPNGQALYSIGTVRDVTDSFVAQEKERLAASVFSHANEGIFICDNTLRIIDVNDAMYLIAGISHSVVDQTLYQLRPFFHDKTRFDTLSNHLLIYGEWHGEAWMKKPSGERYAIDLNISSILDEKNEITHYVGLLSDVTVKKKDEERLNYIAHFDVLTGLPNRILLTDRLTQAMLQTQRSSSHLAVLFVDLDGFKNINDKYGHQVGDLMLEHVAQQFSRSIRAGDTVARFGGDEFVFVIHGIEKPCAYDIPIGRVLESVSKPMAYEDGHLKVSASIGIAFFPCEGEDLTAEALIKQADIAMYQAKAAGKNGYRIYDEGCDQM